MMKSILIATDGSEQAGKALNVGAVLAKKFASRVVVLHVPLRSASFDTVYRAFKAQGLPTAVLDELVGVPTPSFGYEISGPVTPIVPLIELGRLGQRILDGAKKALADEMIDGAKFMMEDGDVADTILAVAERESVDSIVMGHRGFGPLRELLAGSVSVKVAHRAPCTVIAVK